MFGLWHFRNSSSRVIGLILLGLAVRYIGGWAISWSFTQPLDPQPEVAIAPSVAANQRKDPSSNSVMRDVNDAIADSTIPKIRLDGGLPDDALLSPASAAAAIGGLVLLVGGVGAVLLWRRESEGDEA